jgi:hypothetical protein
VLMLLPVPVLLILRSIFHKVRGTNIPIPQNGLHCAIDAALLLEFPCSYRIIATIFIISSVVNPSTLIIGRMAENRSSYGNV